MTHDYSAEDDRVIVNSLGKKYTVAQLKNRVSVLEPGIVQFQEMNGANQETLDIFTDQALVLAAEMPRFGILVLLPAVDATPSSEYRKYIPKRFREIHAREAGRLALIGVAFTASPVARVITKFLVQRMVGIPFAIERDAESAARAIRTALGKP